MNSRYNQQLITLSEHPSHIKEIRIYWLGGEPLVAESTIDIINTSIVSYCEKEEKSYKASIATNASLISTALLQKMIDKWKVDKIEFYFDGAHDRYNNRKGFETFNHNINLMPPVLSKAIFNKLLSQFSSRNIFVRESSG